MIKNTLKAVRHSRKIALNQLSVLADISVNRLNKIENYGMEPTLEEAFKISKLFATSIDSIFIYINEYEVDL